MSNFDRGFATGSSVPAVTLLPSNRTPLETALSLAAADRRPLPAYLIKEVDDPWTCPEHLLGYCAYTYSVDLWDPTWPAAKKRSVIANAIKMARIKGTEEGIRQAIDVMGGKLIKAITPPASLYLSVNRTPAEKAAFLAKMPQLRIYPRRLPGPKRGFYVGDYLSHRFPLVSTGDFQSTPRVTIYKAGVETDLTTLERRREDPTISNAEEALQVRQHVPAHRGNFFDGYFPLYPQASTAKSQVFTLRTRTTLDVPGSDVLSTEFLPPSLDPVDVRFESVREGRGRNGFFPGAHSLLSAGPARRGYLLSSRAREQVFKRVYLYDPDAPKAAHNATTFIGGNMRFGMPAFTAELRVQIRNQRPRAAFDPLLHGYTLAPSLSGLEAVTDGVRAFKSHRDRVLIDTKMTVPVTFGSQTKFGQFVAGTLTARG